MYDSYVKELAMNISTIVDTVNTTADNIGLFLGETNAALDTWLNTFQPGLDTSMTLGIEKLTLENANIIPNRDVMENMAERMINYTDNLSPEEFDKIHNENNSIIDSNQYIADNVLGYKDDLTAIREENSATNEKNDKLSQQQKAYEQAEQERAQQKIQNDDARSKLLADSISSTNTSLSNVLDTESGEIVTGLNDNVESIESILKGNNSEITAGLKLVSDALGTDAPLVTELTNGFTNLGDTLVSDAKYTSTNTALKTSLDTFFDTNFANKLTEVLQTGNLDKINGTISAYSENFKAFQTSLDTLTSKETGIVHIGDVVSGLSSAITDYDNKNNPYAKISGNITSEAGKVIDSIGEVKSAVGEVKDAVGGIKIDIPDTTSILTEIKNSVDKIMQNYQPAGSNIEPDASIFVAEDVSYKPTSAAQKVQTAEVAHSATVKTTSGTKATPQTKTTVIISPSVSPDKYDDNGNLLFGSTESSNNIGSSSTGGTKLGEKRQVITGYNKTTKEGVPLKDLLRNMTDMALKSFSKAMGYSKAQDAANALVNKKKITAAKTASSFQKEEIGEWNTYKSQFNASDIKKQLNYSYDDLKAKGALGNIKFKKYAKGTLSASAGLAQIWEEGPEIITTKKGTFVPFTGGEGVIPADLTKNLVKMALLIKDGGFELKMPDMSGYKIPEPKQEVTSNSEINIGSLITINGNADQTTVDQIKEIAQNLVKNRQFQENVTKFVSTRQAADGVMAGKRKAIR